MNMKNAKQRKDIVYAKGARCFICIISLILYMVFSPCLIKAQPDTRSVTDTLGRQVVLKGSPERVIALAPSITEIIFALGQGQRIVGVSRFSDYPHEAEALPKVGSYIHLDLERIVALRPDLCIAIKDGNPIHTIRRLEDLGIPVYAIDPRNIDAVTESIERIGDVLGAGIRAGLLVKDMNMRLQRITSLVKSSKTRPRVFFQIGISPVISTGTNTLSHEIITLAGGINVCEGKTVYPRLSREEVLESAPDVIIITSMAGEKVYEQAKDEWLEWKELPAVKNRRVFLVDSNLFDRPTPRLLDGIELLIRLIHPELFKGVS